ncbi:MAG: zinc ribbon domain-containing protein [Gammaproteobacteria bacterium]|nr:zinc ribbon domain-containing protein [Gammaproteobacteria bacterium]
MPIYEYQCQECGHQLEKLQKMSDNLLKDCPECEKPKLKKLVSASAFKLKGSGWYESDFKNKKPAPAKPAKAESSSHSCASGACCPGS